MPVLSASKLRDELIGTKTKPRRVDLIYTVDKAVSAALYASIIADSYVIPDETILILKDGATQVAKLGDGKKTWSTSESLTVAAVPVG